MSGRAWGKPKRAEVEPGAAGSDGRTLLGPRVLSSAAFLDWKPGGI